MSQGGAGPDRASCGALTSGDAAISTECGPRAEHD